MDKRGKTVKVKINLRPKAEGDILVEFALSIGWVKGFARVQVFPLVLSIQLAMEYI